MATAYLKWTDAEGQEERFALEGDEITIGRRADSDLVLPLDTVSRQHARLIKDESGYSIVNLSMTQGTYVNKKRVEIQPLFSGDRIALGQDGVQLLYLAGSDSAESAANLQPSKPGESLSTLTSLLRPESSQGSDLEKLSVVLDFQHQWGKLFSSEKAFEHILGSALKISGAERGFIQLKREARFEYVIGLDASGRTLGVSEFQTSQSVVEEAARRGETIFLADLTAAPFAEQQSIVGLRLRSLACMPLRWLSAESDQAEVRGIMYLDGTRNMRDMSSFDQKILNKLALEASNVFEKLELIRTLEEKKGLKFERDLARNELMAADALRRAETQVLMSEYAVSMARFAAALSHELNTPLGALKSALMTGNRLVERKRSLPPHQRAELEEIERELRKTAIESVERIHEVVLRMQRITNLDRDEEIPADLNALLRDVVELLKSNSSTEVKVELDLDPLPLLTLGRQQLSAVFANLLQNAIERSDRPGTVRVNTRKLSTTVEVAFQNCGKELPAEELTHVFDLAFKMKNDRMSSANWGLFSSRQIVRGYGGDIRIESSPGRQTEVIITLPYRQASSFAGGG
jgi:signal transduction histidine kinase/pSer/pThr/pTyr-binding forkhead associated (FHA) protein